MMQPRPRPVTIGVLSTWHVYEGATPEPYVHTLIRGIRGAAADLGCNLLIACGTGPLSSVRHAEPAWPFPETNESFVPVGPWNTDGLVILPTELSVEHKAYLEGLEEHGFPVVFAGASSSGYTVTIDNRGGILSAMEHLAQHGHRHIAFIAGLDRPQGDSDQRRNAYWEALDKLGLERDERLLAYGQHHYEGGRQAMRQILAGGVPFTAVVASNDRSAMGAMEALSQAGLDVPNDVAIIGFDDVPEAQAARPALTTLRNPTFRLGYQAVVELQNRITAQRTTIRQPSGGAFVPVPLVVRYSCGCNPGNLSTTAWQPAGQLLNPCQQAAQALLVASPTGWHSCLSETEVKGWIDRLAGCLAHGDRPGFERELASLLDLTEQAGEDVFLWNQVVAIFDARLEAVLPDPIRDGVLARSILEQARAEIGLRARLQVAREQFLRSEKSNRLGLLTAQLLAALEERQIKDLLAQHLPELGIRHLLAVVLLPEEGDRVARSSVLLSSGFDEKQLPATFRTRQFPLDIFDSTGPLHLALLPLALPDLVQGYIACEAEQMELLGALTLNLATALRNSYLYRAAVQGRRMAEEADQLKSRFLSMVSHELRTPINLIIGLSEMLLRQDDQTQPLAVERWLDIKRITSNAQHLSNLINDVLDLASSQVGQLRLLLEPLDLSDVFRPVVEIGRQMALEKGLDWSVSVPASGPWVMGDRTRLRQVVLNLVSNAVKFTVKGKVHFAVTTSAEEVTIAVTDTGVGVPLDEQEKIFSEFGRSEMAIKRGISGLGLGLAIATQLVERQGGKIGLHSSGQEGSGSTFYVRLPVLPAPQESMAISPLSPFQVVVLLASRSLLRERLAGPLQERGFTVHLCDPSASDGWLLNLTTAAPGFIILDERLVAEQGWVILDALKRQPATESVPLMICKLDDRGERNAVAELDYLFKPLTPNQLLRELERRGLHDSAPTILVVDDNADIRDLHVRLLREHLARCLVIEADNGLTALNELRQTHPDLVLLDLMMPGMDGFTLLETMRADERWRDIPVVVLTAKTLTEADMTRLAGRVPAIFTKDLFSFDEIAERVARVLAQRAGQVTTSQLFVRKAIAFIQGHFAEPLTRDQIAAHVNINPDHLTDCFHKEVGLTPMTYLNRYRIYRARRLIESGVSSITEVMLQVGFSDSAHFSHVFQHEVGISPRRYMIGHRK